MPCTSVGFVPEMPVRELFALSCMDVEGSRMWHSFAMSRSQHRERSFEGIAKLSMFGSLDRRLVFAQRILVRTLNPGLDDQLLQICDSTCGNTRVLVACWNTPAAQEISFLFGHSRSCHGRPDKRP